MTTRRSRSVLYRRNRESALGFVIGNALREFDAFARKSGSMTCQFRVARLTIVDAGARQR